MSIDRDVHTGDWRVPELGRHLDIRTDLPRYRV